MAGGRFGAISPELERQVLALADGQPATAEPRRKRERLAELVAPAFAPPATWVVPLVVPSLANDSHWQARSRVSQAHRRTVNRHLAMQLAALVPFAFGYHHATRTILCVLTRLGGRALDRTVNLPASLKYVEDAVCLKLGIDDGCSRWRCEVAQEPGGPTGVRIELEME